MRAKSAWYWTWVRVQGELQRALCGEGAAEGGRQWIICSARAAMPPPHRLSLRPPARPLARPDETLVHSSFKPVPQPDYIIPVEIEGRIVDVYVIKRPFVDHFLRAVGSRFEVRA